MSILKKTVFRYASARVRALRASRIFPAPSNRYRALDDYELEDWEARPVRTAAARPNRYLAKLAAKGLRGVKQFAKEAYCPSRYNAGDEHARMFMGFTYRLG